MNKIKTFIDTFNDYLADKLSYILSIMTTFYFILMLVIIPLFYVVPKDLVGWAQYLCSVVFQGIALPVLGYTARKTGDKTDKLMNEMYRLTKEIDRLVKHIEKEQNHIHKDVENILDIENNK